MSYIYNLTDTWNAGATTFTAVKMNVTDTASAAGSLLMDLQVGGVSQFKVSKAGAVTAVGVAIPTISSSDTLSNKTLSSPTVSGTIAGAATWTGKQTFNNGSNEFNAANCGIEIGAVGVSNTPYLDFHSANGNNDYDVRILASSGTAGVTGAGTLNIYGEILVFNGGLVVGSPTGGNKGAGTINATAVYDDGVLLTCYVLEHWIDGAINIDAWNARVPNREIPAVIFGGQEIEPARIEIRKHLPAQGFARVADARLDIDRFRQFLIDNRRLPAFPGPDNWADMFNGKMSTGDVLQRLWETVEVLAVHACKARERELALETRIAALENA